MNRVIKAWRRVLVEGTYTKQEWVDLCNRYDNRCVCCGERATLFPDHVVPTSKGGTNYISNIQPLCRKCNSSKRDKEIDCRECPFIGNIYSARKTQKTLRLAENTSLWWSIQPQPGIVRKDGESYFIYQGKRFLVPEDL